MSDRGIIRSRKTKNSGTLWFVEIVWQGKKWQFSKLLGRHRCISRSMAERLKAEINTDIDKGIFNPLRYKKQSPLRLSQFSEQWIKNLDLSAAGEYDYKNSFKNHILPILGDEFLPDINKEKLQYLMHNIKREPKGKYNVMGALGAMMRDAWESGHIQQMPIFPKFKGKNAVVEKEIIWISEENQWLVIDKIPMKHRHIFIFMKLTGCRPSEARAFRKQDIKTDHIVFAKTFGRGEELKEVKSKKTRTFPMTDALFELLRDVPRSIGLFVFINPTTSKPYSKNINKIWNRACEKAGLGYVPLNNSMRHSFGNQLLNQGVDMEAVRRLMGHTTSKMTQRYAQHSTEALKNILDNVKRMR